MYTEPKFLAMKDTSKAKRMAELLRVIILQLGDDVPRARREYETYAEWIKLPESERLTGKNQAQMIDIYKTFRTRAGLGFERDVYLEQEPGDRETPNEAPPLNAGTAPSIASNGTKKMATKLSPLKPAKTSQA